MFLTYIGDDYQTTEILYLRTAKRLTSFCDNGGVLNILVVFLLAETNFQQTEATTDTMYLVRIANYICNQ